MAFVVRKIGLAVAISPTAVALLKVASRLSVQWKAELVLVHIGKQTAEEKELLEKLLQEANLSSIPHKLIWREGSVVSEILEVCHNQSIDLLIAGALKKENLIQTYIGSVARQIMRKANCSVLMVQNPSAEEQPIQSVVVNAEEGPHTELALQAACKFAQMEHALWLHVVRELKLLGLALAVNEQRNEEEYAEIRQELVRDEIEQVEKMLAHIPHNGLKVNIKMLSGKSGFELARFTERKKSQLLVVSAPRDRLMLLDRLFPHDLEYIFGNLPCNLLVVKSREHE
ncbi:MAG: universal stress protein [Cytophagales bacterium]